ncbi:MAG: hypothetical protein COT73_02315, partial [Bdellovibrio sp. CG10_big_fil_rev_8_21_14_0_10_47_8]
ENLAIELSAQRQGVVNNTAGAQEILYSLQTDEVPRVMRPMTEQQYALFKRSFLRNYGDDYVATIVDLPEDITLFINSLKSQPPHEQIRAIEDFVRTISYYDMKNKEVMDLKRGKSFSERLEIMEVRVEELREQGKDTALAGKKYAGVCADFALLTSAILRQAGFVSGVLAGFNVSGKRATLSNAHGTAWVAWPSGNGQQEIFAVDGTPDGLAGISRPSLRQYEEIREEKVADLKAEAVEQLDEVMKILDSHNVESIRNLTNGKLESILNAVLRYEVKQDNLAAIKRMLEAYWYSPARAFDLSKGKDLDGFRSFFASEIVAGRESLNLLDDSQVGSLLFNTVKDFLAKMSKASGQEQAYNRLEQLADTLSQSLNKTENKALAVIVTYLRAKQIKGDNE